MPVLGREKVTQTETSYVVDLDVVFSLISKRPDPRLATYHLEDQRCTMGAVLRNYGERRPLLVIRDSLIVMEGWRRRLCLGCRLGIFDVDNP